MSRGAAAWSWRRIEAALGQSLPRLAGEELGVDLALPERLERLALRVIIEAGEPNQGGLVGIGRFDDLFDQVESLAQADNLARFGRGGNQRHRGFTNLWL